MQRWVDGRCTFVSILFFYAFCFETFCCFDTMGWLSQFARPKRVLGMRR